MFYCPHCKSKVFLEIDIKEVSADFSTNILTNALKLSICSIGNCLNINVKGYKCPNCMASIQNTQVYMCSQLSNKVDSIANFVIISVKNKNKDIINGQFVLTIPPKIIHKSEIDIFKKKYSVNDDLYIINPVNEITYILPK